MKKILVELGNPVYGNNAFFAKDANNMNEAWIELRRRLAECGYELTTADDHSLRDVEWILFTNSNSVDGKNHREGGLKILLKKILRVGTKENRPPMRPLYKEARKANLGNRVALFLWEAGVVIPGNFKKSLWKKFPVIFTWDDDLVDDRKFFKFYLPTPDQSPRKPPVPFAKKKLLVNMSANKHYPRRNELFSARVKTSLYWDRHYPDDFDLFGARWHMPVSFRQRLFPFLIPRFKTYRGPAKDKMGTISQYKFALCYENIHRVKGYVTEKIFDILQARTVPIYWGASNVEEFVDPKAFVDRRRFQSEKALADYIRSVTEKEYEEIIAAGQKYLQTDGFKKFLPPHFAERIIEVLGIKKLKSIRI